MANQNKEEYYMGVPVDKLPNGLHQRLQDNETNAKLEFAFFLQKYLKRKYG